MALRASERPVVAGDLNLNDPVRNTATEYMYQLATITYHTLNGTQTVVPEDVTAADGTVYKAGTYEFAVAGRYWSDFNRGNPIEAVAEQAGPARHGLIAELGVGTATATALQLGLGIAALFAGFGLFALIAGLGLVWVTRAATQEERSARSCSSRGPSPHEVTAGRRSLPTASSSHGRPGPSRVAGPLAFSSGSAGEERQLV